MSLATFFHGKQPNKSMQTHEKVLSGHGYRLEKKLAQGRYSDVYVISSAQQKQASRWVAKVSTCRSDGLFYQERKVLASLRTHPNIACMMRAICAGSFRIIISELAERGDLHRIRKSMKQPFDQLQALAIFVQLMNAVIHCHKSSMVHRGGSPSVARTLPPTLPHPLPSARHHTEQCPPQRQGPSEALRLRLCRNGVR